jgi:NAD(P)-dependent dehydrogenase (short-subunit alcohol dehydrogenase family)
MSRPVLLIAGGSRGIGAATARLAGQRGYDVAVNYKSNAPAANKVVAAVKAAGGKSVAIQGDMGREDEIERVFKEAEELGSLTHLVHSAGITGKSSRLDAVTTETVRDVLDINTLGAVHTMALGVAREVAKEGIRINAIAPGAIDTEIHEPGRIARVLPNLPMGRVGTAEEVAEAILFLLSDAASYITGAVLKVSGGR